MRFLKVARALVVLAFLSIAVAGKLQAQTVPQDPSLVEYAFRAAITAWAYDEHWRLYAMGTKGSRATLSETDFVERMRKGTGRPRSDVTIHEVRISGSHAVVQATLQLEYRPSTDPYRKPAPRVASPAEKTVQVILVYEDGDWRINIQHFVGMSGYY